jgi:hypothetical protein
MRHKFTPKEGELAWGLVDTHEKNLVWMGDKTGPFLYNDEGIAKIAARIIDVQLGQPAGQLVARLYDGSGTKWKDEKPVHMSPELALQKLEQGTVI